ncbi:hypothetical protein CKO_02770 [Citrobacter koseri ATCC BAA-895]|uniref:Uncharacterized protein n=1 Tax=Citrobacter koseri (strain ATCC BAA-895 / CDC 4225-83 / SGSC4696) TaxID=290338 RepID=A8AK63_CITK8|nr:hypothetical protein CKO_02770 [Citrobacter koseri ATCC BAA-895]
MLSYRLHLRGKSKNYSSPRQPRSISRWNCLKMPLYRPAGKGRKFNVFNTTSTGSKTL